MPTASYDSNGDRLIAGNGYTVTSHTGQEREAVYLGTVPVPTTEDTDTPYGTVTQRWWPVFMDSDKALFVVLPDDVVNTADPQSAIVSKWDFQAFRPNPPAES